MKVVITIPAFNEEKTLGAVIQDIQKVMKGTKYNYEILVVNDGSVDKTVSVAKKLGATVVSHKRNKGLAQTFITEMKTCLSMKADIIVHTDADGQYPSVHIPELIKKVEEGYDLVLGSRFAGNIESMPLMKRLGNIAFAKTFSRLIGVHVSDTTTGFRAFTKDVAAEIEFINTFTYTQEQLIRAAKQKFKITEIPIHAKKTRESRLFKNSFQYAWRAWINIFRIYRDYEPLKFFGKIGGLLFIIGFLVGIYIIFSVIVFGRAGGVPRVILSALMMLTGIQIITFGFLADMMKK